MIIPTFTKNFKVVSDLIDEKSMWLDIEKIESINDKTYYHLVFSFDVDTSYLNKEIDSIDIRIVDNSLIPTKDEINNFLSANNLPLENKDDVNYFLNLEKVEEKKSQFQSKKYIFGKKVSTKYIKKIPNSFFQKIPLENSISKPLDYPKEYKKKYQYDKALFGETLKFSNKLIDSQIRKCSEKIILDSSLLKSNSLTLEIFFAKNLKAKSINFDLVLKSFFEKKSNFSARLDNSNQLVVKTFSDSNILGNDVEKNSLYKSESYNKNLSVLKVLGTSKSSDFFIDLKNTNFKKNEVYFNVTNSINGFTVNFRKEIPKSCILYKKDKSNFQKIPEIVSNVGLTELNLANYDLIKDHNYEFTLVDSSNSKVLDSYTHIYKKIEKSYFISTNLLESINDYKFEIITDLPKDKNEEFVFDILGKDAILYEKELQEIKQDISKYFIYKISRINNLEKEIVEMGWTTKEYSDIDFSQKLSLPSLLDNCTFLIEGYFVIPSLFLSKNDKDQKYIHPLYRNKTKISTFEQRKSLYGKNEFEYGVPIIDLTIDFSRIKNQDFSVINFDSKKISNNFYCINWTYSGLVDHILIFKINSQGCKDLIAKLTPGVTLTNNTFFYEEKSTSELNTFSMVFIDTNYNVLTEIFSE